MSDTAQLVTSPPMNTFIAIAKERGMAMDVIESLVRIWVRIPNRRPIDVDGWGVRQQPGQAGVHAIAFLARQTDRARRDGLPEIERRLLADFPDRLLEWRANVGFGNAAEETARCAKRKSMRSRRRCPLRRVDGGTHRRRHTTARWRYRARSYVADDCSAERIADPSVKLPSQLVLNGFKLKVSNTGRYWISMLSSLQREKDGNVVTEPHCKPRYEQHAEFADRAAKNRFEELVLWARIRPRWSAWLRVLVSDIDVLDIDAPQHADAHELYGGRSWRCGTRKTLDALRDAFPALFGGCAA